MDAGVLYSGGKDSTLAACLIDEFTTVTLCCCTFGITDEYRHAMEAGEMLGFPVERVDLERTVAVDAIQQMIADGYPRTGIQQVHEHALERVADGEFDAVADGTRRDDRVPTVDRPLAQSIEDRFGVFHLAPLAGFGRGAIDRLVAERFVVETGPSEAIRKGDYEGELRTLLRREYDEDTVATIFPPHTQSRVTSRKE